MEHGSVPGDAPDAVLRRHDVRMRGLKNLNATGHCPHMSAPEETIAAVRAYLQPEQSPCPETQAV